VRQDQPGRVAAGPPIASGIGVVQRRPRHVEGFDQPRQLRKTVASFLDDADVSTRKISDQLGHSKVSMTQDRYRGRKLTDRQTADVLKVDGVRGEVRRKVSRDLD